jgi:Alternative complex III, ActD subunit
MAMIDHDRLYGTMAEFESASRLVEAARAAYRAGYRKMDAYSPFHIEGLSEALGTKRAWLPLIVLMGGIAGGATGYLMQFYAAAVDYPLDVGGRPLHSWPMFVPVTFELTILSAALAAVLGMLALNGLPGPYHPVFNAPQFARASRDRFFLCIEAVDEQYSRDAVHKFFESLGPSEVVEIEE